MKGHQLLKNETDLAMTLVNGLNEQQRKTAIVADKAPPDIITGNKRKAWRLKPPGIGWSSLQPAQQQLLRTLIDEYIGRYTRLMKDILWKEIETARLDSIRFAWAGGIEWGQGTITASRGLRSSSSTITPKTARTTSTPCSGN